MSICTNSLFVDLLHMMAFPTSQDRIPNLLKGEEGRGIKSEGAPRGARSRPLPFSCENRTNHMTWGWNIYVICINFRGNFGRRTSHDYVIWWKGKSVQKK